MKKNILLNIFLVAVILFLLISSCNKNIDITGNKAYMALVNLAPNAPPLDIVFETTDTITSGQIPYDSVSGVPGNPYLNAFAGIHDFRIVGNSQPLVQGNISLSVNHYYSLYTYDSFNNGKLNTLILQDFLNVADTSSLVRVLNFSPNVSALYLRFINGPDTINYKFNPFVNVPRNPIPSMVSRSVTIHPGFFYVQAAVDSAVNFSYDLGSLVFIKGKVYTLYTRDPLDSTKTNFLGIIQNK